MTKTERQLMVLAPSDTKEEQIQMTHIKDRLRQLMVKSSRKAEDKWFTQMAQYIGEIGKMTNGALLVYLLKEIAYLTASFKTNKNKEKELKNIRPKLERFLFI